MYKSACKHANMRTTQTKGQILQTNTTTLLHIYLRCETSQHATLTF